MSSDVRWIKLSTQMFEDEKIRLIENMPESDTILIIWVKLLAQAGKTNASGYIYLNENIPYTDEMLATLFNRPLNTIRLALNTFKQFGMIEINDNFICITNWDKHQNLAGLEKIREQNRLRKQRERERKKFLLNDGDGHVTVTQGHATDIDKEIDIDIEKENIPYEDIISFLNQKANTNYRSSTPKTRECIKARWKEGFRLDDFIAVIVKKTNEWLSNPDMCKYIRPQTLFGTKFESYLNQKGGESSGSNKDVDARNFAEENNLPF